MSKKTTIISQGDAYPVQIINYLSQRDAQCVQPPADRLVHRRLALHRRQPRPHPNRPWQAGSFQPWLIHTNT